MDSTDAQCTTRAVVSDIGEADDDLPVASASFRLGYGRCRSAFSANGYAELKQIVKEKRLFDKQVAYYAFHLLLHLSLLVLSFALLAFSDGFWLEVASAALLAFSSTQLCFIAHDVCHRAIFRSGLNNDLLALVLGNLLLGFSRGWWTHSHNLHHGNPNHSDIDPDAEIVVLAFTERQACNKRGFARFVARHQAYLFVPLLSLEAWNLSIKSIHFLLQRATKYRITESILLVNHFVLYFSLVFHLLDVGSALVFIFVYRALQGIYLGMTFATNHKGMPMFDTDSRADFLRSQVLTTRNLTPHPLTDFVFGPLGCQIEHHLFPTVARNVLRQLSKVVHSYCNERELAYHETSVGDSYREVFEHLQKIGTCLRRGQAGLGDS